MLWSDTGGYYMTGTQTISLSESVSSQTQGILLHWQGYKVDGGGVQNYQHQYVFVSKRHVENSPGAGVSMILSADTKLVSKYVYVDNNQIKGHEKNSRSDFSLNGITVDNRYLVLTEVLGV